MGKFIKEFLWRASFVVIGALLGPIVYNFIGQQYPDFIKKQPRWLLSLIFFSVLFFLSVYGFIHRRNIVKRSNLDRQVSDFIPPFKDIVFAYLVHKKVYWEVGFHTFSSMPSIYPFTNKEPDESILQKNPNHIDVRYEPICPKCGLPLEESDTFFGLYKWKCPEGDYHRLNRNSFHLERKRATIIARKDFKSLLEGRTPENFILFKSYQPLFDRLKKSPQAS